MAGFWERLFSGGKYEEELKEAQEKAAREPKNLRLRLRIGDLLEKQGKRAEAIETYRAVAEEYARKGLLIQAIALHKLILRLDPTKSKLQEQITKIASRIASNTRCSAEAGSSARGTADCLVALARLPQSEVGFGRLSTRSSPVASLLIRDVKSTSSISVDKSCKNKTLRCVHANKD